ncbi:MAG: SLC45 family MFS transporter [Lentisphaerae bacterium]|nr:SLC45 family MFS transporter [Lentisphaerota bacterium]
MFNIFVPSPRFPIMSHNRDLQYNLPKLLLVSTLMILSCVAVSLVCYNLVPNVKPVLLDRVNASAEDIALILGSIPQIINFVLCPLISTLSDRTRTKFGRRTPYLIISAPLLVLSLLSIAWYQEITDLVIRCFPVLAGYPNTPFWVLAVLMLIFQILYLFPGSVVYYLIADVIPAEYIGRYMAISSGCSSAISAGFSWFILKYAFSHMKLTFCIIGVFYLAAYILQLLYIKEGTYPPVEDKPEDGTPGWKKTVDYLAMFFRQCFKHKIFVFLFLCTGLNQASTICRGMYNVLFATKELNITIAQYGKIIAIGGVISTIMAFCLGKFIDKYTPMFVYFAGGVLVIITNIFGYFFVHNLWTFGVIGVVMTMMYAIQNLAGSPLLVKLLPMEKYGQFASANSMVNSVTVFLGAWLGGKCTAIFGYRVMFIWDFVVTIIAMVALWIVYREWKRYGGKDHYVPPEVL